MKSALWWLAAALALAGCHAKDRFTGAPPGNPYARHGSIGGSSAVIAWTTDTAASSVVEFGPDTNYGSTAGDPYGRVRFHKVALSGLAASSLFHYRVRSFDGAGNTLYGYDRSFRTFPAGTLSNPGRFSDDFERGIYWEPQTYTDSQGVTGVLPEPGHDGHGGTILRMICDAAGADDHRSKGEALLASTGADAKVGDGMSVEFGDATGKTLSADIFAPAAAAGPLPSHSNGIQLFVKDANGGSQYGPWYNLSDHPDAWFTAAMQVGGPLNAFTSTDPPFDPTLVNTVGVKFGISPDVGPTFTYTGSIDVDNVTVGP